MKLLTVIIMKMKMKIIENKFAQVKYYTYLCTEPIKRNHMKKLTVTPETFTEMILGLIKSGVTFDAKEINGVIIIEFSGGY